MSREALARRAMAVRGTEDAMRRALSADGTSAQPAADPRPFLNALVEAEGADAVLLTEAAVLSGTRNARRAHLVFALTLPDGNAPSTPPLLLEAELRAERGAVRRHALTERVERAEDEARKVAVAVVESLRGAADALPKRPSPPAREEAKPPPRASSTETPEVPWEGFLSALGWASVDPSRTALRVLEITEDPYRELRASRMQAILERRSARLPRSEHAALLRCDRADALIPLPDRSGIASRWCERIGLPLPSLSGGIPAPRITGPTERATGPLVLLTGDLEERARLLGGPSPDAHGVLELLAVVGELLTLPKERERGRIPGPIALAAGSTRLHGPVLATLARRLSLSSTFVCREASVDRSAAADVLREFLFVELDRLRALSFWTLSLTHALDRTAGLGEVIAELHARARMSPLPPSIAPHRVAEAFQGRAPAQLEAAVLCTVLEADLERVHDEDWFRNPRTGRFLEGHIEALRATGASALSFDPSSLVPRAIDPFVAFEARVKTWFSTARA